LHAKYEACIHSLHNMCLSLLNTYYPHLMLLEILQHSQFIR
jgi:hypothetical protein